jgi:hypothetical protein
MPAVTFDYKHPDPELCTRLEVGLYTIRVGFTSPSMSWELRNRLTAKGWRYYANKDTWNKHHADSGLRLWHSPWWIGAEFSLPRLLPPHNNSGLDYDHAAALKQLKKLLDNDIGLGRWKSPAWDRWLVNRLDVTGDFIFKDKGQVKRVLRALKQETTTMLYRPVKHVQKGGVKWTTRGSGKKLTCSAYDKYAKDHLKENEGKLRFTVGIEQRSKSMLKKYGMTEVSGLMADGGLPWLLVVRDEVKKIRPTERAKMLRLVVNEACGAHEL